MNSSSTPSFVAFRLLACFVLLVLASGCSTPTKTFATPDQAVDSLVDALRPRSQEKLHAIFGSATGDLKSGDDVADQQEIDNFLAAYDVRHRLVEEADGKRTLVVGDADWPLPIPLVKRGDGWTFDVAAGKDEIINRRVGRNETSTVQTCLAFVDAQRDYAMSNAGGGEGVVRVYARKFISDPGQKNGLFWPTEEGEPPSPLGLLVAAATHEGYTLLKSNAPQAYHGYRYRILESQGPHAPGGAYDYVVGGRMIGGFAAVAYPAEYGSSGVMTFIVSHAGAVYQADLGKDTERIATSMKSFEPDPDMWEKAEESH